MKLHHSRDVAKKFPTPHHKNRWTAVVPAAGRGSRLGYDKPKILFPISGRPIIDWLIDLLEPNCQEVVFILSPSGQPEVEPYIKKRLKGRYQVAIQAEPKGMADAIYQAVPGLATPHTVIIWGDQVAIRPKTMTDLLKIHESTLGSKLTLPIVKKSEPYVHYQTDPSGAFFQVLERREGAAMPKTGLSDCGLFLLDTKHLQDVFEKELRQGVVLSKGTKEWNFLPLLPQFEHGAESVNGLVLDNLAETVGVNDQKDVAILEAYFKTLKQ